MSYEVIFSEIENVVYENGQEFIAAQPVQDLLKYLTTNLGTYNFGGIIEPTTIFSYNTDLKWMFFASQDGTYPNFGDIVIEKELAIIIYDGSFAKAKAINYYLPAYPDDSTLFLNGQGQFSTPTTPPNSYISQSFTTQTSVTVTHIFGCYPVVQIVDNTGAVIIPLSIVNNSVDDFTVTFPIERTGTILATVGSPAIESYVFKSANYTLTALDTTVEVTSTGKTITLPTSVGKIGKKYKIINSSSGFTNIATTSSQTIGNLATNNPTTFVLNNEEVLEVVSNGINWKII